MHVSRARKKTLAEVFRKNEEALTATQWLNLIGAVNKCGGEMELLQNKYGWLVFGVNIDIFYENMPDTIKLQVERARYHNTRIQNEGKSILNYQGGLF